MKVPTNRMALTLLGVVSTTGLITLTQVAKAEPSSTWSLKASIALVDAEDTFTVENVAGGTTVAGGNAGIGVLLALEYRWSEKLGIELGTLYAKSPDLNDQSETGDSLGEGPSFQPIYAGINYYFAQTTSVDVYAGPRFALVHFADFSLNTDTGRRDYSVDSEVAWGAAAGIVYHPGNMPWRFTAEATYLQVDMHITPGSGGEPRRTAFNPFTASFGVAYAF